MSDMVIKKRKNLYLYLALVCFIGIIAIFVVDGYLGVYDTIYMTAQEREQKVGADYWQRSRAKDDGFFFRTEWKNPVYFRYVIDNNGFTAYKR